MELHKKISYIILIILDGWGIAPNSSGNAITQANTPNIKRYWLSYPHTQLSASGISVGLPSGEDGNTETGHLNIGAGRIVYQDLERINRTIKDGAFYSNTVLNNAIDHAKKNNSNIHLMGLIGGGFVHSSIDHLKALVRLMKIKSQNNLFLHLFTDGRDSSPKSAVVYLEDIQKYLDKENVGKIATVLGRYWAMDRDQRWDRTEKAYLCLTQSTGEKFDSFHDVISYYYKKGITDEFIDPSVIVNKDNEPVANIADNDSVIFFNFRIDRTKQLTESFLVENIDNMSEINNPIFKRKKFLKNLYFVTMTKYSKLLDDNGAKAAFPPEIVDVPLGRALSIAGMRQYRITESEKERFITFYLNGLREDPFPLEERKIFPSPKVATYDKTPEMSSDAITKYLLEKARHGEYKLFIVNYPNADMVAHTGNIEATKKAVEKIDEEIGIIGNFINASNGLMIITADHGNAEEMLNAKTGDIDTEHSKNPVPFIAVSPLFLNKSVTLQSGILADISPTILTLLNIPIPQSMTGKNILNNLS